jgi:uncharacterized protein (DUF1330 family)
MSAYLICRVQVRDPATYSQYTALSPQIIAEHGGRFLARGGTVETLEGEAFEGRVVVVEFPSIEAIKAFYHSPAYQTAKKLRDPVSDANFIVVAGC